MDSTRRLGQAAGIGVLLGGVLFVAATLMHPPATNPWTGNEVIAMVAEMEVYWQVDHALMLLAMLLWLGGLSAGAGIAGQDHPAAGLASRLFVAGLTIWVLILAMELTVFPVLSAEWGHLADPGADAMGVGLFAFGIMAGDLAMMLAWIGVSLLAVAWLARSRAQGGSPAPIKRWFAWAGILTGLWGTVGIPVSLLLPDWSLLLYPLTSGPVFLWTLLAGWRMLRGAHLGAKRNKEDPLG